jgi:hypothetical protein
MLVTIFNTLGLALVFLGIIYALYFIYIKKGDEE